MTSQPQPTSAELRELLDADEEELFERLGEELFAGSRGMGPLNPRTAAREARQWYAARKQQIHDRICPDPVARDLVSSSPNNLVGLAAIFEAIPPTDHAALLLGAVVIRLGITAICSD